MGSKSFAIGEAGMLCTDDPEIHERAIAFAHYERHGELTLPYLKSIAGLPFGGVKGRMNQTCAAMGRVQLRYYPQRIEEIQSAMNRFWDLLEGVPGIRPHRTAIDSCSTMGGWYNPVGHYLPEELAGMPVEQFIDEVKLEGGRICRGTNFPLHLHPLFHEADVYRDGRPTNIRFAARDVRQGPGTLPVSESLARRTFGIPWFKHDWAEAINHYAAIYRSVAERAAGTRRRCTA
jgi:perosamine synthetase